jgi:hypothetical protein
MNSVFKMMWRKAVMVLLEALSQSFPGDDQENQLKLKVHSE